MEKIDSDSKEINIEECETNKKEAKELTKDDSDKSKSDKKKTEAEQDIEKKDIKQDSDIASPFSKSTTKNLDIKAEKGVEKKDTKQDSDIASPFLKSTLNNIDTNTNTPLETKLETKIDEFDGLDDLQNIFNESCKLYRFDKAKGEMLSRGSGKIFINKWEDTGLYRIMMCREKVKRLGCNHYVDPRFDVEEHAVSENTWIWHTENNKCENNEGLDPKQTFVAKFNDKKIASEFKEKYKEAQKENKIKLEEKKDKK